MFFVLFIMSVLLGIISIVQNERKLAEEERIETARQDSLRRAEAYLDSLREVRVQDSLDAVREEQAKVAEIEAFERKKAEERVRKEKQAEEKSKREAARATTGVHNGHEWVDLGLSVLWATSNVGASSPSDYGNYYAWGETTTKSSYAKENSRTYDVRMDDISGNPSYDAATANWGRGWRMPTKEELKELELICRWQWTTQGGNNGYKMTGPNGNSIFLPAAGWRDGTLLGTDREFGGYWSSTPRGSGTQGACNLTFDSRSHFVDWDLRGSAQSVRPVLDK